MLRYPLLTVGHWEDGWRYTGTSAALSSGQGTAGEWRPYTAMTENPKVAVNADVDRGGNVYGQQDAAC